MIQKKVKWIIAALVLLVCYSTHALQTDKEQVMNIAADSADLNQKARQGIYIGNVEFTQGSSSIRANEAMTYIDDKNRLSMAVAKGAPGKPAHFSTKTDVKKPPFHAYADVIKYYPKRHLVVLIGQAQVSQGDNSMTAEKITYDTINHHVKTFGKPGKRIRIVLHPEEKLP